MILPTFSEEQLLSELLKDYEQIKRIAKKQSEAYLFKVKKSGRYIRETEYVPYTVKTTLHNEWGLLFDYNQTKHIPWRFRACCIVESDKKTKDYYVLRGLSSAKPYFVKFTSHALKRYKERNKLECYDIDLGSMACFSFEHKETAICMRFVDIKYNKLLIETDDADVIDDMSFIVLTNRGVYFATQTPCGNYIFKTYVSSSMGIREAQNFHMNKTSKWSKEGELLDYMIILHQYYNKAFSNKEILDNYLFRVINKDDEMTLDDKSAFVLLNS